MRTSAAVLVVAVGLGVMGFWLGQEDEAEPAPVPVQALVEPATPAVQARDEEELALLLERYADDPMVGGLLDPNGSVEQDLEILSLVFDGWLTNFPHGGNPVGENVEITAALTGRNRLKLEMIPAEHPAINAKGELCDRWGTPLFFHQISGMEMELRSAGPDRRLHTDDDVLWSP